MLVELPEPRIEFLALRIRQRKRLVLSFGSDAVPEFLDQLQPLGSRQLEQLFAKGVRHSFDSASDRTMRQVSASRCRLAEDMNNRSGSRCDRLREIPGVASEPGILKNARNCPLYLLCFAVANERGATIALRLPSTSLKELR